MMSGEQFVMTYLDLQKQTLPVSNLVMQELFNMEAAAALGKRKCI